MYTILLVVHTIIVLFLIILVLIQRTSSDGMSGLSGGGGNQFLTGSSAANLLTRTTAILAGTFMLTSLVLAVMASRMTESSIIDKHIDQPQAEAPLSQAEEKKLDAKVKSDVKEEKTPVAPVSPAVPKPE